LNGRLEEIEPILNPDEPNKQATKELIDALSTVPEASIAYQQSRALIDAVKSGYEEQTGEKI